MKNKILFASLFLIASFGVNAQTTIFDPSTYAGDLGEGMMIVDVNGTDYLRIVLNGWQSSITLDESVTVTEATHWTTHTKMALAASDTLAFSMVNTFLKLADEAYGDLAVDGQASHADFAPNTVDWDNQGTIVHLQVAGQANGSAPAAIQWDPTIGDTLWIGKIDIFPSIGGVSVESPVADKVSVFPNPTTGELTLSGIKNVIHIEVIGINGAIVKEFDGASSINISELSKGVYMLKIYTATDLHTAQVLLK